jgi:hypothetical protein
MQFLSHAQELQQGKACDSLETKAMGQLRESITTNLDKAIKFKPSTLFTPIADSYRGDWTSSP